MTTFKVEGPRTFVRVSDEQGNLVAYVAGKSIQETEERAKIIADYLSSLKEGYVPLSLRQGDETPEEWYHRTQQYVGELNSRIKKLEEQIEMTRQNEREVCAQIAENFGPSRPPTDNLPTIVNQYRGECTASAAIAGLIRERSKTPEKTKIDWIDMAIRTLRWNESKKEKP